ncbi:MAG: YCF48-related protein [Ignavibacteria bacterium]
MKSFCNLTVNFIIIMVFFAITAPVISQGFNSIYSLNGSSVWVVGPAGTIYRSNDGGSTFLNKSTGSADYYSIIGVLPINLWISGSGGTILYSTNNGNNFTAINTGITENFTSIYFTDNLNGWVVTATGKIYKSTNAGSSWSQQSTPATNQLNRIRFIDANTGAACGNNGTFLITVNGGNNWSQSVLPVNKDILSFDIIGNVIFASCRDSYVLKSTNLGANWSVIDYLIKTRSDITGIDMISANTFYSTGIGGFIRKSTDGGAAFTYQNNPAWADLDKMFFYDSLHGWATGKDMNLILRTSNGGQNWFMPNGTTQTLSWVQKIPLDFYTSSGNVFWQSPWNKKEIFVTKSNRVYRSLDIGETWSPIGNVMPYGTISNTLFVSPKDSNLFLVAIDSNDNEHGKVLRSIDYCNTWTATFSANRSSDGIPMAMDPNHTDTIYYGPTDSVIFRSTNFGLSFSPLGSHYFENICAIKIPENSSNTIIVGSAGYTQNNKSLITRSTDYGVTWTEVDSNRGPYPEVPAIISSSLDPVMYVTQYQGNEGGVKRTFNGGSSWSYINIDNAAWGFDIASDDPNVIVYAVWSYAGNVPGYISFNKGINFSSLPPITLTNNFSVYFYNRSNLLLQQANGFYKLKATFSIPIGIQPVSQEVPQQFSLGQNFPNPFNPNTIIRFNIPLLRGVSEGRGVLTQLIIYDITGREVSELVNEELIPGTYEVNWNAVNYPSGVYFYKLTSGDYTVTKKMVLIK